MKIYTRSGDQGTTSLYGGTRVDKDDLRVESYGCIDELNSILGVAATEIKMPDALQILQRIQGELLTAGGDLATQFDRNTHEGWDTVPRIGDADVERLEQEIDAFTDAAGPLSNFILPGGSPGGAMLHHARTVCRRAERRLVNLQRHDKVNPSLLPYINRLSDHLFEFARWINHQEQVPETIWSRQSVGG